MNKTLEKEEGMKREQREDSEQDAHLSLRRGRKEPGQASEKQPQGGRGENKRADGAEPVSC